MPINARIQTPIFYRLFLISILVVAAIVAFGFVADANVETVSAGNTTFAYRWNLADASLPLLSLPDHLSGAVDLSITYSLDQFQFPLFQSLYYSQRLGKYLLMVMPKQGGRVQFIDLTPARVEQQSDIKQHSGLRLEDKGSVKMLTTSQGTVYTFAPLGDGEFHCIHIEDRDGSVIDLTYTKDASIETIVDISGRTISFGYEKDYVNSITQTWGLGLVKRQTWAITDDAVRQRPVVQLIPIGAIMSKRIPTNARTPAYTSAMAASDLMLASIFGGPGAVAAANGFEPVGLASQYPLYRGDLIGDDGKLRRGHLSYAMHLYGSENGTADTELYVPSGFTSHSNTPTPTDAAVTFYYPQLGNLTDVTLAVFHVADFHLSYEGNRVRIGKTGGRGGSIACYRHAHFEFYRGNTGLPASASRPRLRIDPTTVFETSSNIASQTASGTSTRPAY